MVGEPINSATGNAYQFLTIYVGAGPFHLFYRLTYNSSDANAGTVTAMGNGWRGSYDRAITVVSGRSTPTVLMTRADGKSYQFTQTNGQWSASANLTARLVSTPAGWIYTLANGTVETYDLNGRLLSVTNRVGLTQNLSYDGSGRLVQIADPAGRTLSLGHDAQNRVATISNPAGGVTTFTYDTNNNLSSVIAPDGAVRTYVYENARFPSALTGLVDERGNRFASWSYDTVGRAVSSVLAGGIQHVTLTYGSGTTGVTDAAGVTRQHDFQAILGEDKPIQVVATCSICTGMTSTASYDANGNIASRTDFNGVTTTYVFDLTRNLETSRTEAFGTPQARTITTQWHPTYNLPTLISEPGKTTLHL